MIKIFKYLKSSYQIIAIIILLLVVQAVSDLSLPEYTSKIINVGVQQSGIETTVPKYIKDTTLNNLYIFMNKKDKEFIEDKYELSKDIKYSEKENFKLYKINTTDKKEIDKIASIMKKPLLIDYGMTSKEAANLGFPLQEGVDPYIALSYMTDEQKSEMLKNIDKKLEELPSMIVDGAGISRIKSEYEALNVDIGKLQTDYILLAGAKMLGIALLIMGIAIVIGLLGARLAAKLAQVVRIKVFDKVVKFSKTEMKKFGVASLITRTTNDVSQIQQVIVIMLRVVFYAPIMAIGGIIKITNTTSSMGWIIGAAIGVIIFLMGFLFIVVMPRFKLVQKLIDKVNLVSREILTGLPVIRAFNNERHEEKRFDKANKDLTKVMLFVSRTMAVMMPLIMLLMNLVCVAIVWKGAYAIDEGTMQVGDMMAYIQYTMQIIMSFLMIAMMSIMLPRAQVSANRLIEVIETENIIKNIENEKTLDSKKKGVVEFKNVCFRYPDATEDVLTDISFKSVPGTTTAFIGSTGSGKSTVINLIPRFYDVTEGSILVDGVDIRYMKTQTLRSKIGFVPQKGMLFSGTIESNIKFGKGKISEDAVKEAARISQAEEFIETLDKKYETEVSQGGTNVSGGQRQRLSIARAIAMNPDIYVFDDSFSALDFKTDAKLRKELNKVTKNSTVFIVAQRINTIMHAEQIVVLNEGKVTGIGTHKELMKNCDVYKEIALSQLSEEELKNES